MCVSLMQKFYVHLKASHSPARSMLRWTNSRTRSRWCWGKLDKIYAIGNWLHTTVQFDWEDLFCELDNRENGESPLVVDAKSIEFTELFSIQFQQSLVWKAHRFFSMLAFSYFLDK